MHMGSLVNSNFYLQMLWVNQLKSQSNSEEKHGTSSKVYSNSQISANFIWCTERVHTYLIQNSQYVPGLLSDSSSLVSDDINQLAVVLVQGSQELRLKRNSCNPHEFRIDLQKNKIAHYKMWCVRSYFWNPRPKHALWLISRFYNGRGEYYRTELLQWIYKKVTYLIHWEQCGPSDF